MSTKSRYLGRYLEHGNEKLSYETVAERLGITPDGVYRRVAAKWTDEEVVTTPRGKTSRRETRAPDSERTKLLNAFGEIGRKMNTRMALTMRWVCE